MDHRNEIYYSWCHLFQISPVNCALTGQPPEDDRTYRTNRIYSQIDQIDLPDPTGLTGLTCPTGLTSLTSPTGLTGPTSQGGLNPRWMANDGQTIYRSLRL